MLCKRLGRFFIAFGLCIGLSAFMASPAWAGPCGDGILDGVHEQCDDGGTANGDGCDSACQFEHCGNGLVQAGEFCDPNTGNSGNPAAALAGSTTCTQFCTPQYCGDGCKSSK